MLQNVTRNLGLAWTSEQPKQRKMGMRLGTWKVRFFEDSIMISIKM
jgi:hypothetical protein